MVGDRERPRLVAEPVRRVPAPARTFPNPTQPNPSQGLEGRHTCRLQTEGFEDLEKPPGVTDVHVGPRRPRRPMTGLQVQDDLLDARLNGR